MEKARRLLPPRMFLLLAEGLAVSALVLGGVHLVSTHQDAFQGAVASVGAVISTLLYGAGNARVGVAVHRQFLLYLVSEIGCPRFRNL